jgi:hypothetical protein
VLVLADARWADPQTFVALGPYANNSGGGTIHGETALGSETDFLRLDSLVLTCQLNMHVVAAERGMPPMNIVSEKLAIGSMTR